MPLRMMKFRISTGGTITTEIMTLISAIVVAFVALGYVARQHVDFENLAKGEQNTLRREVLNGEPYTAYKIEDIKKLIDDRSMADNKNRILWFGNSQLHYINQFREGDHLSPYWLRSGTKSPLYIEPLGCSLPNINLQEILVLSRYAMRIQPRMILMELVFDDLREDELRADFGEILTPDVTLEIRQSSIVAESILNRFLTSRTGDGDQAVNPLSGTIQRPVEQWLNTSLTAHWSLWASRPRLEGQVYSALWDLRNYVFRIRPTTVRKMIRARYDLNMEALQDVLGDCQRRKLPVLLYIAPIRQDQPIPYDIAEYRRWKEEVGEIAKRYNAHLVNLEATVPSGLWGTYTRDEVDFMHFQGPGHRLVAEALLAHVKKIIDGRQCFSTH